MPDTKEAALPPQKEVIQDAGKPDTDLLTKTSGHLNKAGYHTSPEYLDPNHQTLLDKIKEDVGDTTGAAVSVIATPIKDSLGQDTQRIELVEGVGWRQRLAQRIKGKSPFLGRK